MDSTESNRTHSTKHQSSKSQKHNDDEFEEKDNEKRRKSGGSGRAGSRDEGDHDSRREPNPKIPRKSADDVRSSEAYRDKEYDSGSKNRDDGRESNSSGKSSRSRGKPESHHEDNRYSERKEGSSREKGHRAERLGVESRIEDEYSRGSRERDAEASEKEEKVRQQRGSGNDNGDEVDMDEVGSTWMKERSGRDVRHVKRSGTPERSEWHHRDVRMRSEDGKASSSFRDAREKSDSIEIKPEKNVDFGREEADSFENYGLDLLDSQDGKERGQKGPMDSNCTGAGQSNSSGSQPPFWNNQGSGSFNRGSQQGPKGGRPARGGRTTGRDVQRVGTPLPMMPPPFGPPGLTSGPLQPIGSPGLLFPPLQGPIVWTMPPPGSMAPRFSPMYFNQPGLGRGAPPNTPGPGFDSPVPVSREAPQDKSPMGWATPRNYVPPGRAPSRGEQNDYSQNFVDTGMRPQNFIRELELTSTVEDYPKLRDLIQRKDEIVAKSASPPMYYKCDLHDFALTPEFFGTKFDVILVDPPWEEYVHRAPGVTDHLEYWPFEEIQNLKIEAIADTPSFIFLWVGDGVGLEQGRQCLKKWGFRRCEDICWVKTNKRNATPGLRHDSRTLFQHSKEHCLMGIKGTVRRSTDGHIIHANIDTDVIIAEEPSDGSTKKPEDMYRIIEHFALGKRRLELFGEDHNIRSGWLTLGKGLSSSNFNPEAYIRNFADKDGKVWQGGGGRNPPPETGHLVLTTPEIESLRPKSPPPKNQQQQLPSGSHSGLNQDTSVSGPATPAHWASSSMVGSSQGTEGGEHGVSGEKMDDGYRFNASIIRAVGDHIEIDPRRAVNNMT